MAAAATQAPKEIDLKNPDLYVQAVPHDLFAWLRESIMYESRTLDNADL